MLRALLWLTSIANIAGGIVLALTFLSMMTRVPPVVFFIGLSLLIQGTYTVLLLLGRLDQWKEFAHGALFSGECLSFAVGFGGLVISILSNMRRPDGDVEMAPVLAGLMMSAQATVALVYLLTSARLKSG